jgi:hypothetical protein
VIWDRVNYILVRLMAFMLEERLVQHKAAVPNRTAAYCFGIL